MSFSEKSITIVPRFPMPEGPFDVKIRGSVPGSSSQLCMVLMDLLVGSSARVWFTTDRLAPTDQRWTAQ